MEDEILGRQDGKPQRRKPRPDSFTPAKRQKFLDALALTCNAEKAAAHAGVNRTTPYYARLRDAIFAAQWRDAIDIGYDRLETMVLEHGGAGIALPQPDPDRAIEEDGPPPFDFDKALAILRQYRAKRDGVPERRGGRPRRNATREETNAALLKAITAAEKRLGLPPPEPMAALPAPIETATSGAA